MDLSDYEIDFIDALAGECDEPELYVETRVHPTLTNGSRAASNDGTLPVEAGVVIDGAFHGDSSEPLSVHQQNGHRASSYQRRTINPLARRKAQTAANRAKLLKLEIENSFREK